MPTFTTIETWQDGQLIATETVEVPDVPQQPLPPAAALATLLAVTGVLTVTDAANAVGETPEALTLEAQAWAVAAQGAP